jgi:hypothetical protein
MVPGQRELVVGLNRDPQFGPCVMLGIGNHDRGISGHRLSHGSL